jgi:hypothetical protein
MAALRKGIVGSVEIIFNSSDNVVSLSKNLRTACGLFF